MSQKTMLALALLLAFPLLALAAASDGPAAPAVGPAPLALCAAVPTAAAPEVRSEPAPELFLGEDAVTCSAYCGHPHCLGIPAGEICSLGPGRLGLCTPSTTICSTDGIKRCTCIEDPA